MGKRLITAALQVALLLSPGHSTDRVNGYTKNGNRNDNRAGSFGFKSLTSSCIPPWLRLQLTPRILRVSTILCKKFNCFVTGGARFYWYIFHTTSSTRREAGSGTCAQPFTGDSIRGILMRKLMIRRRQSMPFFRRAVAAWPHVFIAVSVAGLAYIALIPVR